jgi:hypothetical protein
MDVSILRKYIRSIIQEYYNNTWVYTYGPNKFPYFTDLSTPAELDAEFDKEFGFLHNELDESEESSEENDEKNIVKNFDFPQ